MQPVWKVYFFFLIFYEAVLLSLSLRGGGLIVMLLHLPYLGFAVALFGVAFERPILKKMVWRYAFAVALLFYAHDWLVKPILYLNQTSVSLGSIVYIQAFSVPLLPLLFALYLYAWRCEALWVDEASDSERLPRFSGFRVAGYLFSLVWLLLFPVFGANAAHFGWGFFPLIASGFVVPVLAIVLFADLYVTVTAAWQASGGAVRQRFSVPAISACLFLGCSLTVVLMFL